MRDDNTVATILSVGTDPGLLNSRNAVLRHAGYHVVCARSRHEAVMAVADSAIEVAVICFSIPADEAHKLAHDLEIVNPRVRVLVLNDFESMALREEATSPAFLLHMIRASLAPRTSSARP